MRITKEDLELLRNVIMSYCEDNPEHEYNEGERLDDIYSKIRTYNVIPDNELSPEQFKIRNTINEAGCLCPVCGHPTPEAQGTEYNEEWIDEGWKCSECSTSFVIGYKAQTVTIGEGEALGLNGEVY